MVGNSQDTARDTGVRLFVVIGAQRTGTNLLREILNTNEQIAMLGEVLSPSPAPAHWENFCRHLPIQRVLPATVGEAESLLDLYFEFVQYRIRNYWEGGKKRRSQAFGIDIKYNQLAHIAPANWNSASSGPFLLCYLRSRRATLIHTTRNVIHSAISSLIASQRNLWHNYDGVVIDRRYHIDVGECLSYARTVVQDYGRFLKATHGSRVVDCRYEDLIKDIRRAEAGEWIPQGPGPLKSIAEALGGDFNFRYDGRLQKAINVPYRSLLSNYDALIEGLRKTEFSAFVPTLE